MNGYLKKNSRTATAVTDEDGEEDVAVVDEPVAVPVPSSGTKVKHNKKKIAQAAITSFTVTAAPKPGTQNKSRLVASMLNKSPEEVVAERHKSKQSQPTLEHLTKRSKEAKVIVDDHVADFFMRIAFH
jgi:lambda repressor-like predicted transcriptional regulator